MITIVNYGLGNVSAFTNIYKRLCIPAKIANVKDDLNGAEKIILPGVGAFDWAMNMLDVSGMRSVLEELVVHKKVPVLGVCLGMQILADQSDEGDMPGLGWVQGKVKKLEEGLPLPHMGWNDVTSRKGEDLFRGIEEGARFYFLHSYHFVAEKKENIISTTDYGCKVTSGVRSENIFGVQFHPEKSHGWGIQLLKNFVEM